MQLRAIWYGILLGLAACQGAPPDLPGFDAAAFRADRRACAGVRQRQIAVLTTLRQRFVGLTEPQVRTLLGRPEHEELADRGQRSYGYYLTPATSCGGAAAQPARLLTLGFDALNRVQYASLAEEM